MTTSINVPVAHQDESNHPHFFVYLRNGTLRAIKVPGDEAPFVVWYRGQYRVVFSRMETDEEYFRNHPEMPFRLKWHMTRSSCREQQWFRNFSTFKIVTRHPHIYATGSYENICSILRHHPGTPRARLIRACLMMLTNSMRCTARFRDEFDGKYNWAMTDAELWRFAMHVLRAEYEYPAPI